MEELLESETLRRLGSNMSLQKIKDDYAKSLGFEDYKDFNFHLLIGASNDYEKHFNELMSQSVQHALEEAEEKIESKKQKLTLGVFRSLCEDIKTSIQEIKSKY